MSSFLKRGKRIQARADKKELKHRTKDFYKILHELDALARMLAVGELKITEDNVVEEAAKYTTREIADMEKFILLGKIEQYKKNG